MISLRFLIVFACLFLGAGLRAQTQLPDAPQPPDSVLAATSSPASGESSSLAEMDAPAGLSLSREFPGSPDALQAAQPAEHDQEAQQGQGAQPDQEAQQGQDAQPDQEAQQGAAAKPQTGGPVDANGNPIPLERYQPHRLLGFMPNFRTVSAGAAVHPPGWKYNFTVATHQATDYSTFIFLGLTSLFAEGTDEHPSLGKGADGFYAYAWRGFLDKTDGTYLSAWLLPSLLHEDTRYYPLGSGHSIVRRELYVISRQAVTRTYSERQTPNIAGLGGKALTQYISRYYYPSSTEGFGVLTEKFGYSVMRDVIFSNIREFYPDLAAHFIRKHREKVAQRSAQDATASGVTAH
jgi:hypothetical protein